VHTVSSCPRPQFWREDFHSAWLQFSAQIKSVFDIYVDALSQLGIRLEVSSASSSQWSGKITAHGEAGIKLLTKAGIDIEGSYEKSNEHEQKLVGHDINDLRYVAEIIKHSGRRLVIEDFHYMRVAERKSFAFDLKALWDYGLFVVIIGVWSQSNMLLYLNPDLSGRISEIKIYWSPTDLSKVITLGGTLLNLKFSNELINRAIGLCFENAGILQALMLSTLDNAKLVTRSPYQIEFDNVEALESAALFYADQLNPLYQQFAKRVASGIRKRNDSTGIYAHAMAVIIDADDKSLMTGLHIDQIYGLAKIRQPRIQKGNLKTILEKFESLQVDEDGRGLVLAYNEASGDVTAVDRQLLLYRQYCTVNWPWEDLIREAEQQVDAESD
jgi:hypothetical protein